MGILALSRAIVAPQHVNSINSKYSLVKSPSVFNSIFIAGELTADGGCPAEGCPVPAVGGVGDGHARHVAGAAQGEAWAW